MIRPHRETARARRRREAAEAAELPARLQVATEALADETERANKAEASWRRASKTLSAAKDEIVSLEGKIMAGSETIADLRKQLDAAAAEFAEAKAIVAIRDAQIADLEKRAAALEKQIADAASAGAPKNDTAGKGKK